MARSYIAKLILTFNLLFIPAGFTNAEAPILRKGYYTVVAAYLSSQESLAEKYSIELNKAGHHSNYGFDPTRNLHYVYLDYYTDFNESINQMLALRKQNGFADTWVRIIKDGTEQKDEPVAKAEDPKPKEKKPTEPVAIKIEEKKEAAVVLVAEPIKQEPVIVVPPVDVIPNPKAEPVYIPQTLKNTLAFFSLYNATNNQVVDGEVEVVDTERSLLISKMKANTYLQLPDPKSKSGKLTLIGSAFGYRKVQHEMSYLDTEKDTLQEDIDLVGNYYLVKFDLTRLHKGDIATLYNVYFYNDAAVMLPESKYELNNLFTMMQENPGCKVMLHGHTNGNGRGKIIMVGPSKDFFSLSKDDVVNESASAKELSGARAQVIKDWLVSQRIGADRIEVKAWGGGRMLHDKNSQHARRNVRVEVEILED